jgi:hypothetical protein
MNTFRYWFLTLQERSFRYNRDELYNEVIRLPPETHPLVHFTAHDPGRMEPSVHKTIVFYSELTEADFLKIGSDLLARARAQTP